MGGLQRLQLNGVLFGSFHRELLQAGQAVFDGRALRRMPLQLLRMLREGVRVLGVFAFQSLDLVVVLVRRVSEQLLEVIQALANIRVCGISRFQRDHFLGMLGVRVLHRLKLLQVLVSAVPDSFLEETEAIAHRGVRFVAGLQILHIFRMLSMGRHELRMSVLELLHLASMLVGRVPQEFLQVREAVGHRRMAALQVGDVAGVPKMRIL
mmetsp:Transcript_4334/g.12492  ORF Transcript_4334/g.12492 Transcript_4334/m.12492 type:complete len:209 (-) Transcript_4334:1205-1831(-)